MTNPVDTDALRDLQALSGGILSRNLLEGSGVWKINRDVTRALGAAADEVDRLRAELAWMTEHAGQRAAAYEKLRAVVETAPHDSLCNYPLECRCWKEKL